MPTKHTSARFAKLTQGRWGEVVRFGIVGALATLLQYAIYLLLQCWTIAVVANTVGYAVSFIFNYVASTRFTFRVKSTAKRGAGFALAHAVNFLLQTVTLHLFLLLGVPKALAPIPMFCICVPVNFLLVRFFLKK